MARGEAAANVIARRAPGFTPRLGLILGSGLGGLADAAEDAVEIEYGDLPGFPAPGVAGHGGRLVLGKLGGLPVAILQGRRHIYEGGDPGAMRAPVRALQRAGAAALLATNAAGSLRPESPPGSLMAIAAVPLGRAPSRTLLRAASVDLPAEHDHRRRGRRRPARRRKLLAASRVRDQPRRLRRRRSRRSGATTSTT